MSFLKSSGKKVVRNGIKFMFDIFFRFINNSTKFIWKFNKTISA